MDAQVMSAAAPSADAEDEPYESLVRQQLDALGYDSAAIPDDVRRAASPPLARSPSDRPRSHRAALVHGRCCARF